MKTNKPISILELNQDNYKCPVGEEMVYHCRIEVRKFSQDTGERISIPRIQKFEPKGFETFILHNLKQQGYTVDILHNPREWERDNAERLETERKEREQMAKERAEKEAEEKAKAEAEEKQRLRAELKAEILAELKESGVIPEKEEKPKK